VTPNRRVALLGTVVVPLVLLGVAWITTPHTELNNGLETDGIFYLAMARNVDPVASHSAPMAYRVLTPLMTRAFPGNGLTPFSLLSFVCNWATLALLHAVLRRSSVSQRGAVIGVLLYAGVFWSLKYSYYSPALVDFQTQLFLVGILYLMLRRWWWAIPPAIALGVAQKESILAMAAVVAAYHAITVRTTLIRRLAYVAALFVPGVIVYLALRAAITPLKDYPSGVSLMIDQTKFWLNPRRWNVLFLCIFSGLGLLPVLIIALRHVIPIRYDPPFGGELGRERRDWRGDLHWYVMIAVGAVLLVGGLAKSRLFLYMLPAVVVLVSRALDRWTEDASRAVWVALGAVLVVHFAFGNWFMPVGNYQTYLRHLNPEFSPKLGAEPYVRTFALLAAGVVAVAALSRSASKASRR
jgi:hypothetical protein